jgi:hypothetical protein
VRGGGGEASEAVTDGHGLGSSADRHSPGPHWGRVVGVLARLDDDLVAVAAAGDLGGLSGDVSGLGPAACDTERETAGPGAVDGRPVVPRRAATGL